MSDGPTMNIRTVDNEDLPFCARCGQRALMEMDLRRFGRGVVALCQSCDQARPARAAWLNLLTSGKLNDDNLSEAGSEEATLLWSACLMDVLSASPLGLATNPDALGKNQQPDQGWP